MVQHNVDDDSGDRDVKPDRKGPYRDLTMPFKLAVKGTPYSDQDEWHHEHGKKSMSCQDCEIDRPDDSPPQELRWTYMKVVCPERVVEQIARQEYHGAEKSGQHAFSMRPDFPLSDENEADYQKGGA